MQDLYYSVKFELECPLHEGAEYEYLTWVHGEVVGHDEQHQEIRAGTCSLYLVDFTRAYFEGGLSLARVLDYDPVTANYAKGLLGDGVDLAPELKEYLEIPITRLLIVHRIEILPGHRGKKLGLWVMYRILDTFEHEHVLPVIHPWPLQFAPDGATRERPPEMERDRLPRDRASSFEKIRQYWAQIGFKHYWGSGEEQLWLLNPELCIPARQEVLKDRWEL